MASWLLRVTARPVCRSLCWISSSSRSAPFATSVRHSVRIKNYLKDDPPPERKRGPGGGIRYYVGEEEQPGQYKSIVFSRSGDQLKVRGTESIDEAKSRRMIPVMKSYKGVKRKRIEVRSRSQKLGLVPTMGALHEGHLSLIRAAAAENDVVWVSIFVNPTQFGVNEDLSTYPRTMKEDLEKLRVLNVELLQKGARGSIGLVFSPTVTTMYPSANKEDGSLGSQSYVIVDEALTGILEGAARPTFFRGVATVVMKLFNIIKPDNAYFGQKDVQQLSVIHRMVTDFMLDVRIQAVPIAREPDGLAMSSRNVYLGERRRSAALVLNRALRAAEAAITRGVRNRDEIVDEAIKVCVAEMEKQRALPPSERARFEVEYISLAEFSDLKEVDNLTRAKTAVLSGTIVMLPLEEPQRDENLGVGGDVKAVRLLDNIMWRNPDWQLGHFRREQLIDRAEKKGETRAGVAWNEER